MKTRFPRPRIAWALLTFALLFVVTPSSRAETLVEHYVAAMQARGEGDMVGYHSSMLKAYAVEPGHPILQIHLARAAAGLEAFEESASWAMKAFAQGAWVDVTHDEWFAPLIASEFGDRIVARAAEVGAHHGRAQVGFEIMPHDLLPEGIAHDPATGRFFLTSLRERKVLVRDAEGTIEDFVPRARDGFAGGLGLDVDAERRRLWAVDITDPRYGAVEEDEVGRTTVWCFDLDSAALLARFDAYSDSVARGFNDVALLVDGGAIVSDAEGGTLYRIDAELRGMTRVFEDGTLNGPNGLVSAGDRDGDGRDDGVYVAEYVYGITHVDLESGVRTRVRSPEGVTLIGVDGLVLHDGSLVAVQNYAGLDRAARFELSDDGLSVTGCEVLEARHPRMADPTTGVVADGAFWFIANSHIASFDAETGPGSLDDWTKTLVLRVDL